MIRSRRIAYWLAYLAYLLAFLVLADYVFYRLYLKRIARTPPQEDVLENPFVDRTTAGRIGYIGMGKKSSFSHFPPEKPPGTFRIGCFGDSFTFGDEVDADADFPSILGELSRRDGRANVEVLNFGSPWHGFHQSFIMADEVGSRYGLDAVVLGPGSFQWERDSSFNHTFDRNPYYLHARFVLDDGSPRLIDVSGKDLEERRRRYYRFIPEYRYLRYDIQPPPFLRCLLPRGRSLRNPFYYYGGPTMEERNRLFTLLLSRLADRFPLVVLGHYEEDIVRLARSLHRPNLTATLLARPMRFPYLAPWGHNSPLGNELVAVQMRDLVEGKEIDPLPLISVADIPAAWSDRLAPGTDFRDYRSAAVSYGGAGIGLFVDVRKEERLPRIRWPTLLVFTETSGTVADGCFVPVTWKAGESMEVTLQPASGSGGEPVSLGTVSWLAGTVPLGRIEADSVEAHYRTGKLDLALSAASPAAHFLKPGAAVTLRVGSHQVMDGEVAPSGTEIVFRPATPLLAIRGNGHLDLGIDEFRDQGPFDLTLATADGREERFPLLLGTKISAGGTTPAR